MLFVVIVVFLLLGISTTILKEAFTFTGHTGDEVAFDTSAETIAVAVQNNELDKQSYLQRIKAKLAQGEGQVIGGPVFTSVDTPIVSTSTASSSSSSQGVVLCNNFDASNQAFASWPSSGISLQAIEGTRVFSIQETTTATVGTTTQETSVHKTILELPIRFTGEGGSNCVSQNVVGVTATGILIDNRTASAYASLSEFNLIGYALDGYPIYGPAQDASTLDACGGRTTVAGYQYHVQPEQEFVLACYGAQPSSPNF